VDSEHSAQPSGARLRFLPSWAVRLAPLAVLAGVAAFVVGAVSARPGEAWTALLVNWLFWMGLAQAGVVWAATLRLAGARWSGPVERLGEACVAFLPLALIPAVVLALGWRHVFPWTDADLGDRVVWLGIHRLLLRTFLGLGLMGVLSLLYVRHSLRQGAGTADERSRAALVTLKVAVPLGFTVVYSLLAFDWVMALHLFWASTALGLYFIVGALYAGMALLILLAGGLRRRSSLLATLRPQQFQDCGNLLMAFGMVTTYMLFSQLIVIWYENLPLETDFLIARIHYQPWWLLSWLYLGGALLLPFVLLTIGENKARWTRVRWIAGLVLVGMGLERYLLVAPSLAAQPSLGLVSALLTLGFAGGMILALEWYMQRYRRVFSEVRWGVFVGEAAPPEAEVEPE
jgi:hypothetical protein